MRNNGFPVIDLLVVSLFGFCRFCVEILPKTSLYSRSAEFGILVLALPAGLCMLRIWRNIL